MCTEIIAFEWLFVTERHARKKSITVDGFILEEYLKSYSFEILLANIYIEPPSHIKKLCIIVLEDISWRISGTILRCLLLTCDLCC